MLRLIINVLSRIASSAGSERVHVIDFMATTL